MSDYTRTERQRNFLKAVADKLQSGWNLIRMKEILDSVSPYIETNLAVSDMLKLAQLGVESHVGGTAQVPPMELVKEETIGGASVISIRDEDALLGYVQEILSKDDTVPPPSESPDGTGEQSTTDGASSTSNGGSASNGSSTSSGGSTSNSGSASPSRNGSAGGTSTYNDNRYNGADSLNGGSSGTSRISGGSSSGSSSSSSRSGSAS